MPMTPQFGFLLSLAVSFIASAPALSQEANCGAAPALPTSAEDSESLKGSLKGQADLLSKFVGKAELGGEIETAKKKIYQTTNKFFAAQKDAYLAYILCVILMKDTSLSTPAKLDALQKYRDTPSPAGASEPTACKAAVLRTINLPDVPTLDGNGSHVGNLSGISVSIVQECPTPTEPKYQFHLDYGYYNGSGTWRGEQHLILVLKSSEGASLKTATIGLDRSRCIYGGPEKRSADGVLDGGTGTLVSAAELTVSRVSGTQTGC
jgi:hypothetical protein